MTEAVKLRGGRVKCDSCGYKTELLSLQEFITWEGKSFPECGFTPMLSAQDVELSKTIVGLGDTINELFGPVNDAEPKIGLTLTVSSDSKD